MKIETTHPRFVLALLLLIGTTFHTVAGPAQTELPIQRTLTDTSDRKLDVTILEKEDAALKVRRTSDGKVFSLALDKLSAEDREFAHSLQATPPAAAPDVGTILSGETARAQIEISVCGTPVTLTRVGSGPLGVIFFGHTGAERMNRAIIEDPSAFAGLLPDKASFFLWEYPSAGPFKEVGGAIDKYLDGDKEKGFYRIAVVPVP